MKTLIYSFLGGFLFLTIGGYQNQENNLILEAKEVITAESDTLQKDPETGLYQDKNLYMVKAQCTNCHSTKVIMQHRYSRDSWKEKIRWMQANHNLWELGETEGIVLDYLEKYYGPEKVEARRQSLSDIKWYKLEK